MAPKKPPYLPLSLDGKKKVGPTARAAGVDIGVIAWGLWELWEHVWATKQDVVDGIIIDGCFGPIPAIRHALVAFGFLEPDGPQYRIRGAKEWLFGSEAAVTAGKASAATGKSLKNLKQNRDLASERPSNESDDDRTALEHAPNESPNKTEPHPASHQPNNPVPISSSLPPPEEVAVVAEIDLPDTPAGFWTWMQRSRVELGIPTELRMPKGFEKWHRRARKKHNVEPLCDAYLRYLRERFAKERNYSTGVFIGDGVWPTRIPQEGPHD